MKNNWIIFICLIIGFTSCKTLSIQNKQYQATKKKIILGSVGADETFELERTYTYLGNPNYNNPIKVQITPISFDKSTFKAYNKAIELQPNEINVNYIDSLQEKPKYLNLEVSDKIGLIKILNDVKNKSVKSYLESQSDAHVVTYISIVFSEKDIEDLVKSDEVYIEQTGLKSLGLKLYSNNKVIRTISFNDGVVFGYRASSVCWKENSKYQLEIIDLVEGDNGCPPQTHSSARRAKKKIDYYKF